MSPLAIALLACVAACAESHVDSRKTKGPLSKSDTFRGCMYEGRWYAAGTSVRTREVCLACVCAHDALSCRRRVCAPLPEPPPRCHVIHQKGECCPELRCPDGVRHEHRPSARLDDSDIETPFSIGHACVEGGTVYAAGSAMSSSTACEQCFCLGGTRRCVRPLCLPPPPGCQARPTSGACCPQRYYCNHPVTKLPEDRNPHDCITPEGKWAFEGERVTSAETAAKCIQCFCLRGSIRCQHLSCAPTLQGCLPLVQPGQCCPHQYQCGKSKNGTKITNLNLQSLNKLTMITDEIRSFQLSKSTKRETTIKEVTTDKSTSAVTITKQEPITTMKVKRNTGEASVDISLKSEKDEATTSVTTQQTTQTLYDMSTTSVNDYASVKEFKEELVTEQPERSVKIIINGTINCTAEISSTSLLLNVTNVDDSMWINNETQPRIPITHESVIENHTFPPNDIITDSGFDNHSEFDDNETFTINVTSSLNTNTTRTTSKITTSSTARPKTVPPALLGAANISKVKKEELDFDYTEPTLPPSLPNLKIIPFVAADAVIDEEVSSKESLDYPLLESNDKFPVYFPKKETDHSVSAIRKEDTFTNPPQYPVFISQKDLPQYPSLTQKDESVNIQYPSITNDIPAQVHEYTVTASMGDAQNIESKTSVINDKFDVEKPTVNLFSPPVETEGGFVPKDPGIDEYYSVYQNTPPAPIVPHLTTSMQLELKDECVSSDGRHVSEGESINFACSLCICAWGELHCSPRPCNTPPGCKRRAASASTSDLCCGELVCDHINQTTLPPLISIEKFSIPVNESKIEHGNDKIPTQTLNSTTMSTITMSPLNNTEHEYTFKASNDSVNKEIFKDNSTNSITMNIPYELTTENIARDPTQKNNHSVDYEEEDDDKGFSLGSVLQFLLSETYETTTTTSPKPKTTVSTKTSQKYLTTSPELYDSMNRKTSTATGDAFLPVTNHFPIFPPKKIYQQNTINRIDHLILGESNAIRKTTMRPVLAFKPLNLPTTRKIITTTTTTTQKPLTTKLVEITSKEGFVGQSVEFRPPTQNILPGLNLGLPKLAGCNIYGRMYRVGRIIAELSSPCQECKCTELGVQCRALSC